MITSAIKVWWEGNQKYFEADVMDFVAKTNKFACHYLVDNSYCDENLDEFWNSISDDVKIIKRPWYWLDETQTATVIQRKEVFKH
jgi:hypothetical protein